MVKYKLRGLHFNARFIPFIDFVTTVHFFLSSKDCQPGSLNATLAAGKIILCLSESDQQDILSASITVQKAGGVGLIYAQFHEDGLTKCSFIPCIKVSYEVAAQIISYIRRAR